MSIDILQEKIRKTKNPSVLTVEAFGELVPAAYLQNDPIAGMEQYYLEVFSALRGLIPAVRFGFASFAVLGEQGLAVLNRLMRAAGKQGFYVLLDLPEMLSSMAAENMAEKLDTQELFPCDGFVIGAYLGSDIYKPFLKLCAKGKTLFPVLRTSNRSAAELQDLLTGNRLVHTAAADIASRYAEQYYGKCGYCQVGLLAAAAAPDSIRTLRSKYKRLFLLLDGFDYPNANAKNCSYAFDNLGHGAAACAGCSILGAWKDAPELTCTEAAVQGAEQMKRKLSRYITVL